MPRLFTTECASTEATSSTPCSQSRFRRALLSSPLQIIASTPPATRGFTVALVALSLANWYLQFSPTSSLTQPRDLPYLVVSLSDVLYYPWTIITAGFVEQWLPEVRCESTTFAPPVTNDLQLIFTLFFVPASLRYLERLWGAFETIKFVVITIAVSNIVAVAFHYLLWAVFRLTVGGDIFP